MLHKVLHERLVQPPGQRLGAFQRGRQLAVVACQDESVGFGNGYPAGRFECLCCLVDEECAETAACQQAVGTARQGAGYDASLAEEFLLDAQFQFRSPFPQSGNLLLEMLPASLLPGGVEVAYGSAYGPQVMVFGMRLKTSLKGLFQHTVGDPCGIADAQHAHAAVTEFLRYPVHGHVALGAHHDLCLAVQRLIDGFHQRCRLSRTGRPVHHCHILGPEHFVDGLLLRGIEPGKALGQEGEAVDGGGSVADVAQLGQPVGLGFHHAVQRFEHQTVGCFVESELYAQPFCPLHLQERIGGG